MRECMYVCACVCVCVCVCVYFLLYERERRQTTHSLSGKCCSICAVSALESSKMSQWVRARTVPEQGTLYTRLI